MKKRSIFILSILTTLLFSGTVGAFIGIAFFGNAVVGSLIAMTVSMFPVPGLSGSLTMAVTQNTLIGRSRQKVGGTVFRTWKGLNVLQSKPLTVANPNTPAQQARRSALSQMVSMFRAYLSYVRLAFNEMPAGTTQWAQLLKYNLKTAFDFVPPNANFQPETLRVSSGTLVNPPLTGFSNPSGRNIQVSWTDNSGSPGANASDRAVMVVATANGELYYLADGSTRADGSMTVAVPGSTSLSSFECHLYFDNASFRKASDSVSLGTV